MTDGGGMRSGQYVSAERRGGVGLLVLDRPDRLNAWHDAMRAEVVEALAAFAADDDVGAVVLTGAGDRAFSAGQDFDEAARFHEADAGHWVDEWRRLYGAVRDLDKPVVAAVNGVAAGSAFQVALLCDVRIAHPGARLGQPEVRAGLPSPLGLFLLRRAIGGARATELVLSGRLVGGEEAKELGIVHRLAADASDVRAVGLKVAEELASLPRGAMRLNKRLLREDSEEGFATALERARLFHAEAYRSGEPQRLMRDFLAARGRDRSPEPSPRPRGGD